MPFVPQDVTPANIFAGPAEIYVDNTNIGATMGGVALDVTSELGEKTADQTPLVLGHYKKKERATIKFKLSEMTLANLKYAMATVASTAGAGSKSLPGTHEVKIVGNGPNDTTRTFTIFKGRFSGNSATNWQQGEQVDFSVEILMEADPNQDNGNQYFTVADA